MKLTAYITQSKQTIFNLKSLSNIVILDVTCILRILDKKHDFQIDDVPLNLFVPQSPVGTEENEVINGIRI